MDQNLRRVILERADTVIFHEMRVYYSSKLWDIGGASLTLEKYSCFLYIFHAKSEKRMVMGFWAELNIVLARLLLVSIRRLASVFMSTSHWSQSTWRGGGGGGGGDIRRWDRVSLWLSQSIVVMVGERKYATWICWSVYVIPYSSGTGLGDWRLASPKSKRTFSFGSLRVYQHSPAIV